MVKWLYMMKDVTRLAWIVFIVGFSSAVVYFFPWRNITWGKVVMEPGRMITVTGTAQSKEKNQIARFSAGVNAVNDNRDAAIKEVNTKIAAITQAVKDFGIDSSDIITQSMSVNQNQESFYDQEKQRQSQRPGQWNVSNTIEVTLRDVNRASALADILSKSGATNVWGPNFQLDTTTKAADKLTEDAIADARVKAEVMAKASGASLGKVISVTEGYQSSGIYPMMMREAGGGGGAALESGTTTVSKSVTVVWSLE